MIIDNIEVRDIRFPTSKNASGSDAMHTDPDYSCAYVIIHLRDSYLKGYGLAFTLGRGTEIVVQAIHSLSNLLIGEDCLNIWNNFATYWRKLTSESQMRWVGPEKGVIHLATAAVVNALWDLWARYDNKPLWKLLVDMDPKVLVSTIDFRYITDAVTPEECIAMLQGPDEGLEKEIATVGYPAYTTHVGWLGYDDAKVKALCQECIDDGFKSFKIKVGKSVEEDQKRCKLVREAIGWENNLMIDANQVWEVPEAVAWVKQLQEFKPLWIEEPTSPDDVLGHATIARELKPYGIGVATGEMCQNRVIFKQLLEANAISFCQIDSCRLGGVNEVLAVYFMAKKFGVPVCPHAGGVGLCEMVQHLQMWDYVSLTRSKENRIIEWVDSLHEHFTAPPQILKGHYVASSYPGYSTELKEESLKKYEYPQGTYWSSQHQKSSH